MNIVIKYLHETYSHVLEVDCSSDYQNFYYGTKNISCDGGKFYFWADHYAIRKIKSRFGAAAAIKLAGLL